jgi:hypothetical protein
MRRLPEIFMLRAEATLLARARDLAKARVYHSLMFVQRRENNIDASQVYCVKHTEMSTVDRLQKVLTCKVKYQVIAISSGQQGTRVTLMFFLCVSSPLRVQLIRRVVKSNNTTSIKYVIFIYETTCFGQKWPSSRFTLLKRNCCN